MVHLAVPVSGRVCTHQLAPAQLIDCSAQLIGCSAGPGTTAAQVRGRHVSCHLAECGYKGGKGGTRKVMLMGLCALRADWMGTAVTGRSAMD